MLLTSIFIVCLSSGLSYGNLYDYYTGEPVPADKLSFYETNGLKDTCTTDIKPCDKSEWRRVDGSCNNLKHPGRGTFFTPVKRILPANYHNGHLPRKAESGAELPNERTVRVNVLKHQLSSHEILNNNVPGFGAFMYVDIGSVHDTQNSLLRTTYCCNKERMNAPECTPNIILPDDPVLKDTDIRCMNSTKPLTYQDFKCTDDPVPAPIKKATSSFDCSQIYNANGKGDKILRSFEGGRLAVEEEGGRIFPPNGPTASCPNNVKPTETRCPENYIATFLSVALLSVWFVRNHNYIADQLVEVNPCWEDELLYETARDINIAFYNQIFFYEWSASVQGYDNLVKAGVVTKDNLFRDIYDDSKVPEVTLEYTFIIRYLHLMQESRTMLYDVKGNFIEEFKTFDVSFRMGYMAKDNNMDLFTQSTFRAPCHGGHGSVDYELANSAFPGFQKSIDAPAGDINKNRNFGLPPYVDYVKHFFGLDVRSFEDLIIFGLMTKEDVLRLNSTYDHVRDIDLMAGAWCESNMEGGYMPPTVAAIFNDNTLRAIASDRHWYERPNRPHAFTKEQLLEVRKSTLALLMCSVADGVTEIPKNAFHIISPKNPLVPCISIKKMNFNAWADDTCNADRKESHNPFEILLSWFKKTSSEILRGREYILNKLRGQN